MKRDKLPTSRILLRTELQRETAFAVIRNIPLDAERPLEMLVREEVKARKPDQNSLMWVGPLADIAEQGYVCGRTYTAETWHDYFKREYLPEEYDPELCKSETYRKWDFSPSGERILVGSTTDLTVKGFSQYLEQVIAFGAAIGVQFHSSPNEGRRAA